MPEGPEMHRAAREVGRALQGRVTEKVGFGLEDLRLHEAELTGVSVEAVEARGKAVLIHFGGGLSVFTHNQLYGKWLVRESHDYPRTSRQLRFEVHNREKAALLYSASDIEVWETDRLGDQPYLARLGPDVLDPERTVSEVEERLDSDAFRGRQLASVLLDQGFLAGLGNYLRSEILFAARVPPRAKARDLDEDERRRLAAWLLAMPRRSFETGGITNEPARVEEALARGENREACRFQVFNRGGEPCPVCGTEIRKVKIASRRLYYCSRCQHGS